MKRQDNDRLRLLEEIRERVRGPAQELRVLRQVTSQEELSFPGVVSIANAGEEALVVCGAYRGKVPSPTGVDEVHDDPSKLVREAVDKRIVELEKEGVAPAPIEEVTPKNMEGFLDNMSNYLYKCTESAFNAVTDTAIRISEARINPGKATMLEAFCNVIIDQSFKSAMGEESVSSLATRAAYGAVAVYGGAGVNATMGTAPKDTSGPMKEAVKAFAKSKDGNVLVSLAKATGAAVSSAVVSKALNFKSDIPDIMAHATIGLLESGSASGAIYSASKRAMYKNFWKISGGKALLNQIDFSGAANCYLISKSFTKEIMKCVSQAGGEVSDALIEEYTGVSGQTAKLVAGAAGLAILMTINTYICQDKVKSHNPEVVSAVQEELSNNIKIIEKQQQEERLKLAQMSADYAVKEASVNSSDRKGKSTYEQKKHRTL